MKENMKYELRLRQNPTGYQRNSYNNKKVPKNKKDNFMNKSILSVLALICVMLMKMSSSDTAANGLEMIESLLKKQVDYTAIGQTTMQHLNAFLDEIELLKQTKAANSQTVVLKAPLSEGIITKAYTKGTHPLLSTETAPEGITITTSKGAFVVCGTNASITSKTQNADGTYKVFLSSIDNPGLSIVYDGMIACYFNTQDSVAEGQILGMLPSRDTDTNAQLVFCVYLNNEAQDPTPYLGDIYPNEVK